MAAGVESRSAVVQQALSLLRAAELGNDGANRTARNLGQGVTTVVPVTTSTREAYPFQVLLPPDSCGLAKQSKAQAEQIRSVAIERVGVVAGHVPADLLRQLDAAVRLHLGL